MDVPRRNQRGYEGTDLTRRAGNLIGDLLIIHNLYDDNVHFQNALQMSDALQRAGKQFEMMIYPQKSHGVSGVHAEHMRELMLDFFVRTLMPDGE
jgi:dipeptidyl-peptidase-4